MRKLYEAFQTTKGFENDVHLLEGAPKAPCVTDQSEMNLFDILNQERLRYHNISIGHAIKLKCMRSRKKDSVFEVVEESKRSIF